VVEEVTREGEVAGSNLAGRIVHKKFRDLWVSWSRRVAGQWGPSQIKSFLFHIFKNRFSEKFFVVCFLALGKLFAVFPKNSVWTLCRGENGLCHVLLAHGKGPVSRSDKFKLENVI